MNIYMVGSVLLQEDHLTFDKSASFFLYIIYVSAQTRNTLKNLCLSQNQKYTKKEPQPISARQTMYI